MEEGFEFDLFGFPVEIAPSVALIAGIYLLLGLQGGVSLAGVATTLVLIVVVFASILWHELGHAVLSKAYGLGPVRIQIHGLGGTAHRAQVGTTWQSLWISLAGPGAGLLLGAVALVVAVAAGPTDGFVATLLGALIYINIFWSLVNLLPVMPLDGGNALRSLLSLFIEEETAIGITAGVGLLVGAGGAVVAYLYSYLFIMFFMGMFAHRNYQILNWLRKNRDKVAAPGGARRGETVPR